ncbi:hypothetical protein TraAM80_00812 [Trypanosoma rangeli]|uniref:Uncharacterized protein n=1 Tax=Trypanosoma rangeli TaxID=5698 RepID=A0A3R7RRX3_TRYRA|nr:uncharacterized protein TraAM80_00812 [Trypanosoma rangeli]RNF11619.1 hypothetical protein TraAM80_00812 [Trypanosoma rangeli]|eukprot:RNF11619.1 hypothetical protein TraAM80_00812 [Trypanosoma rangeli]
MRSTPEYRSPHTLHFPPVAHFIAHFLQKNTCRQLLARYWDSSAWHIMHNTTSSMPESSPPPGIQCFCSLRLFFSLEFSTSVCATLHLCVKRRRDEKRGGE